MAPTPTTTDAFNAVADGSRRQLLDALGTGEATVGELVDRLGLTQPQVSKHLAVLRAVGLVSVRVDGRQRWYRVNGRAGFASRCRGGSTGLTVALIRNYYG